MDSLAWKIVADLFTPDGRFATYDPDGLEQLIRLRAAEEAQRAGVSAVDLMQAVQKAMADLLGTV